MFTRISVVPYTKNTRGIMMFNSDKTDILLAHVPDLNSIWPSSPTQIQTPFEVVICYINLIHSHCLLLSSKLQNLSHHFVLQINQPILQHVNDCPCVFPKYEAMPTQYLSLSRSNFITRPYTLHKKQQRFLF